MKQMLIQYYLWSFTITKPQQQPESTVHGPLDVTKQDFLIFSIHKLLSPYCSIKPHFPLSLLKVFLTLLLLIN